MSQTMAVLALSVGPSVGLGGLGVGVQPRLEAGLVPRGAPALTLSATLALTRWRPEGEISDARLEAGSATWTLVQDNWSYGLSGSWTFSDDQHKLRPEAGLVLGATSVRSKVDGLAAGGPLGTTVELSTRPGGALFGGLRYALGPGALLGRVELGATPMLGQVTGEELVIAVAPMVGYRVAL